MIKLFLNNVKTLLDRWGPYRKLAAFVENRSLPAAVTGVERGFLPFLLAALIRDGERRGLVVVPREDEARELVDDLALFFGDDVIHFPCWQNIPYSDVSSPEAVFQERSRVLSLLAAGRKIQVVASLQAVLCLLPQRRSFIDNLVRVRVGQSVRLQTLERELSRLGYNRVPRVNLPSEFAVRGEVIDLYVPHEERPVRLLFEFDMIEGIREFDVVTQLSSAIKNDCLIPPVHEIVIGEREQKTFLARLREEGVDPEAARETLDRITVDPETSGIDYFLPLFSQCPVNLTDYFDQSDMLCLIDWERLLVKDETIRKEYAHQYDVQKKRGRTVVRPEGLLCDIHGLADGFTARLLFTMQPSAGETGGVARSAAFSSGPSRSFFGNIAYLKQELKALLDAGFTVVIFADHDAQAERIRHLLSDLSVTVLPASLSSGFTIPELRLIVIAEHEIFKRKKRVARSLQKVETEKIDSFVDLEEGDFIVHIQHGIGCFRGIERVRTSSFERDYIRIEYTDREILFLPTEQVNLIERYIAPGGGTPRLDKIGGKSWSARKEKVTRSVAELAEHLLSLYSTRKAVPGFAFPKDSEWQEQFEAGFPYEETVDQLSSINDVKRDMEQPSPMDRLVCGDVGYGKTEIALRAAFKAVMGGKQVAILAPTTILVEQHYETFCERFENFPVKIGMLSRFVPKSEQRKRIRELSHNELDIVIGTHRLVQKDVAFKNLGLLVIDEEQRFGVRHKERMKELKSSVDCLVLSATPIPRTLYMSLMNIRDMSLLNTPPRNRLPIETFVLEFEDSIVQTAVRREIERGGQVFFLHNRIETIGQVAHKLSELFPELRVAVAHGRMEPEELEDVMHEFIHGNYHILLSTAIIENGIDIPNVNTIIIDRADMFGISQLYQLRGRVGRSDVPAFAYLLYPRQRALSERAMKRLKIVSDFTELGSGFKIALKDLELRGAGNLLGSEQHGDILSVGFDMYMKLLHEAIGKKEGKEPESRGGETYIELEYSGYIPESYITEPLEKMETYKQIAAVTTEEELEGVIAGLEDRFGPLPDELLSIISISELRIISDRLKISSLRERHGVVRVEFYRVSEISADKVVSLIKESGGSVFLKKSGPQCIFIKTGSIGLKEKSSFIKERLARLL